MWPNCRLHVESTFAKQSIELNLTHGLKREREFSNKLFIAFYDLIVAQGGSYIEFYIISMRVKRNQAEDGNRTVNSASGHTSNVTTNWTNTENWVA